MPFPSLIMGLIAKTRLKFSNGLTVVQQDYPIGAHTVTQSTAHIKGSRTGMSSIPRDHVEEEGGDTDEEINRFTIAPETLAQPSSSAPARGPNRLDRLLAKVDQMFTILDSHVQHTADQFAYVQVKSRHYLLRSRTCLWTVVQIQSPTSSILFVHSS